MRSVNQSFPPLIKDFRCISFKVVPVEGHTNFKRDPHTNAIISTNSSDYEKYIFERENKKNLEKTVKTLLKNCLN